MASTAADTGLSGAVHGPVYSVYSVQCTVQSVQRGRGPRMITPAPAVTACSSQGWAEE